MSRIAQNPTLGQLILCGSIHFVLISMQEWVHLARNFSSHVKNRTKSYSGAAYFAWFHSLCANQYARMGPSRQELFLLCQEPHKTYTRAALFCAISPFFISLSGLITIRLNW